MARPGDAGQHMIQFRLRELTARKERLEQRRISYAVISKHTRISPSTLSRKANNSSQMVDLSVVDRLCTFFACTPGELMVRRDMDSAQAERVM